jgi:cell division protease FtsH
MHRTARTALFWLVIVVSAYLLWQVVRANPTDQNTPEISYSEFLGRIANGQVSKVTILGNAIRAQDVKGGRFRVIVPASQSMMLEALQQKGVEIWVKDTAEGTWPNWILNLAPLVLLAALWFYMIRQLQTAARRRADGQPPSGSAPPPESQTRFGP